MVQFVGKAFLLLFSYYLGCVNSVQVQSCYPGKTHEFAKVNSVNVLPDPITVPGDMSIDLSVTLNQPIKGHLDADLIISRLFGTTWIDLPCINTAMGKVGSCNYPDICNNIMRNTTRCPRLLANNKIPCHCNVPAGRYTIPRTVVSLDPSRYGVNLPPIIGGRYQAILRLTDRAIMKEIHCVKVVVELADPPVTFGSIGRFFMNMFGRK